MPGPCPKCGYPVAEGDEFCPNPACGAYLGWQEEQPRGMAVPAPQAPVATPVQPRPQSPSAGTAHVAALSTQRLDVAPGESAELTVTVTNTGTIVDELAVTVAGPLAAYTRVEPAAVQVYPRDHATARVTVAPPHGTALPAGDHPLVLRLTSSRGQGWSDHVCAVGIGAVAGFAARLVPPQSAGRGSRVRAAVEVANRGNAPLQVAATPRDDNGRIRWGAPAVGVVPAGATAALPVTARSRRIWLGDPEQRPFDVTVRAEPQAGHGPPLAEQRLDGRREQHPVLRGWMVWLVLALLLLLVGLLAFLAFGQDLLDGGGDEVETPVVENGLVVMPDVVGADGVSAVDALSGVGLEVAVTEEASDEDAGIVLAQDPAAGTEVEPGTTVNLVVSAGDDGEANEAVCAEAAEARQLLDEQGPSDEAAQALGEVVAAAQSDGVDGTLVELAGNLSAALDAGDADTASAVLDELLGVCG
ncbi:PASTA domain-containing protein [Nocardioides caldifontis]|uniref:PASTA domain-containing protein n=1 Tax=Nocardioides caldifontis TaxID=2588938 RepID=UPI0011DF6DB0|nr:PASTA domain-containing protein [Nocardioides caldifontis]